MKKPELNTIITGNCLDVMRQWPENFVDTIITDPPYGISFMGKAWDTFDPTFVEAKTKSYRDGRDVDSDNGKKNRFASAAQKGGEYDRSVEANRKFQDWCCAWAKEALRIAKPGAMMLVSGGTRTFHRMTAGLEDAGWQIRDCLMWLYASGFPKGHRFVTKMWYNVLSCQLQNNAPLVVQTSKCFRLKSNDAKEPTVLAHARILPGGEKALLMEIGTEDGSLEVMAILLSTLGMKSTDLSMISLWKESSGVDYDEVNTSTIAIESDPIIEKKILRFLTGMIMPKNMPSSVTLANGKPWFACSVISNSTDEKSKPNVIPLLTVLGTATENPVKGFAGHNTNLKPAWEPIILAMKPIDGTFAENAEKWGVAGLNVDGSRIGTTKRTPGYREPGSPMENTSEWNARYNNGDVPRREVDTTQGRWPANLLLDEDAAGMLDGVSGNLTSGVWDGKRTKDKHNNVYGKYGNNADTPLVGSSGGASRFFKVTKGDYECCLQEIASIAESRSSHLSESVVSVLERAVTWVRPDINLNCLKGLSTHVTPKELKQLCANVIGVIRILDGRCLPVSFLISTANSNVSLASNAEAKKLIDTMTTTQNHLISDGSAVLAIFGTTLPNMDHGEAGCRFNYVAKSARAERNEGCEDFPAVRVDDGRKSEHHVPNLRTTPKQNFHPTVKPLELMKYLCQLTRTPTGGIVLDPFAGSGTTLWAAEFHNRPWIGIEMNPEYVAIANARIARERAQIKMAL